MDFRGFRLFLTAAVALAFAESIGGVYSYTRPPMRKNIVDRHLDEESTPIDDYAPQQVSISFIYIFGNSCFQYESVFENCGNKILCYLFYQ